MEIFRKIVDELFNRKLKRGIIGLQEQGTSLQELVTGIQEQLTRCEQAVYDIQRKQDRIEEDVRELRDMLRAYMSETGVKRNEAQVLWDSRYDEEREKLQYMTRLLEESEKCFRRFAINGQNRFQEPSEAICKLLSLLEVKDVANPLHGFCRIGRDYDGGYVMYDDFAGRKVAYSFGINDDVSWDIDMAGKSIEIYMYDHTIAAIPEEHERFHWFQTGIGAEDAPQDKLMSLSSLICENGHQELSGMILKMDVEGAEWDVLPNVSRELLEKFDQIAIELHGMNSPDDYAAICASLKKLNSTHQLVHIHANNYRLGVQTGHKYLPDVLEGTYLLRGKYEFKESENQFPRALDMPNDRECPDIFLGRWGNA